MTRLLAAVLVAGALAGAAAAAGPWPALAQSVSGPSGISYQAVAAGGMTTVKAIRNGSATRSIRFSGAFGIPAVTTIGEAGGLSPSGHKLVLAQPPDYQHLRKQTRFVLLTAPSLTNRRTIVLQGDFGYDAISPNGRWLYLIQHLSVGDPRYLVRAYDLQTGRLLPRVIADKGEPAGRMRGMPISRATSQRGDWVYTLYTSDPETQTMFVHALNAAGLVAHCIDLPVKQTRDLFNTTLALKGQTLLVRDVDGNTLSRIDTRTFEVS